MQTKLEKLLTLFEQKYFVDETGDVKEYNYPVDDENIKLIVDTLHFACTDSESRRRIEAERESFRVFNLALDEELREAEKKMQEKERIIDDQQKTIEQSKTALEALLREKEEIDKALAAMAKEIEELKQKQK